MLVNLLNDPALMPSSLMKSFGLTKLAAAGLAASMTGICPAASAETDAYGDPVGSEAASVPIADWTDSLSGVYVATFLGLQFPAEADIEIDDFSATFEPEVGFGAGLAAGYDFGHYRVEGELSGRAHGYDSASFSGFSQDIDADFSSQALMVNAFGDLPLPVWEDRLELYGGIGLGVARVALDFSNTDQDDYVFAAQVMLGVSVELTQSLSFQVGYRGFTTSETTFTDDDGTALTLDGGIAHSAEVGLRFTF